MPVMLGIGIWFPNWGDPQYYSTAVMRLFVWQLLLWTEFFMNLPGHDFYDL